MSHVEIKQDFNTFHLKRSFERLAASGAIAKLILRPACDSSRKLVLTAKKQSKSRVLNDALSTLSQVSDLLHSIEMCVQFKSIPTVKLYGYDENDQLVLEQGLEYFRFEKYQAAIQTGSVKIWCEKIDEKCQIVRRDNNPSSGTILVRNYSSSKGDNRVGCMLVKELFGPSNRTCRKITIGNTLDGWIRSFTISKSFPLNQNNLPKGCIVAQEWLGMIQDILKGASDRTYFNCIWIYLHGDADDQPSICIAEDRIALRDGATVWTNWSGKMSQYNHDRWSRIVQSNLSLIHETPHPRSAEGLSQALIVSALSGNRAPVEKK